VHVSQNHFTHFGEKKVGQQSTASSEDELCNDNRTVSVSAHLFTINGFNNG